MKTKLYYIQNNVGKAKYVLSYCTGENFHNDGSLFWDIEIFKNKKKLFLEVHKLKSEGYTYK